MNFSDLSLTGPGTSSGPTGSYWNGSNGSGGFTSRGAFFNNSYDSEYGAWSGWSYSNVNDTTDSGYTNQYAAYTGTAVGGSGIYAVGYGSSTFPAGGVLPAITIPAGMQVQSAMFTNTTYAALSMRTGDQFAAPFGPSDWFLLTITGLSASGGTLGSVGFYLAQNGSIVNTWQSVNLSSLSLARTLDFDLNSSDSGLYGINTPAYFAMDDLVLTPTGAATGGTWAQANGGSWGLGSNWSGGSVPASGTIVFAGSTSGTAVVTLDGSRLATALQFGGARPPAALRSAQGAAEY